MAGAGRPAVFQRSIASSARVSGHGHPCGQELVKDELRAHLIGHDAHHAHDCDARQKGAEAVSAV